MSMNDQTLELIIRGNNQTDSMFRTISQGMKGMNDDVRRGMEIAKKAAAEQAAHQLSAARAQREAQFAAEALAQGIAKLGGMSGVAAREIDGLRKKVVELERDGARLPVSLQGLTAIDTKGINLLGVASDAAGQKAQQLAGNMGVVGRAAAALGPAGLAAAAAVAVVGGAAIKASEALYESVKGAVALGGSLADLHARTDVNVVDLQKLAVAGSMVGVSQEAIAGAVNKMQLQLAKNPEAFKQLGLDPLKLKTEGAAQAFGELGNVLSGFKNQSDFAAAASSTLGRSWQEVAPLIRSNVDEMSAAAERLGLVFSESTVQALDAVGDQADLLSQTWEHLWLNIGAAVASTPEVQRSLEMLTEGLGDLSRWVQTNDGQVRDWTRGALVPVADVIAGSYHGFLLFESGIRAIGDAARDSKGNLSGWAEVAAKAAKFAVSPVASMFGGHSGLDQPNLLGGHAEVVRPSPEFDIRQRQHDAERVKAAKEADREIQQSYQTMVEAQKLDAKGLDLYLKNSNEARIKLEKEAAKASVYADKERIESARLAREVEAAIGAEIARDIVAGYERELAANAKLVEGIRGIAGALFDLGGAAGGSFGQIISLGGGALDVFANLNDRALQATSNWEKAAGAIATAAGIWKNSAGGGKGALSGAMSGAAAGAAFGGVGAVVGGAVGGILGLFGGGAKRKQEAEAMQKAREEWVKSQGGMDQLRKTANMLGVDISKAFSTKSPEEFKKIQDALSQGMEDQRKRIEGIHTAMGGLEQRTKGFAAEMAKNGLSVDQISGRLGKYKDKLKEAGFAEDELNKRVHERKRALEQAAEVTDRQQASFERLGNIAAGAFGLMVKETGDVIGTLKQMEPTLANLAQLQEQFGFTSGETFAKLMGIRDVVLANEDVADSISGINQMMTGFADAGGLTRQMLVDLGQDAAEQFAILQDRGVGVNESLTLMQPTIQQLWEHQQKFHDVTDEATLALIKQAEEQGIVGADMMSVNEKMLDVLLAIADVFGAKIPEGMRRTAEESAKTADQVKNDWSGVGGGGFAPGEDAGGGFHGGGNAEGGSFPYRPGGFVRRFAESRTEHVLTTPMVEGIVARAMATALASARSSQGGEGGGAGIHVYIGGDKLDGVITRRMDAGYIQPRSGWGAHKVRG